MAFELIDDALKTTDVAKVGLFTLAGAATFTIWSLLIIALDVFVIWALALYRPAAHRS